MIRLHLLIAPAATMVLSAHFRLSRRPVPNRAPRGVIRQDDAFVFNDANYQRLTPEVEAETAEVGTEIAGLLRREVERRFEVGP